MDGRFSKSFNVISLNALRYYVGFFGTQRAAMNANLFGATANRPTDFSVAAESTDSLSADTAWTVLDAANELGDVKTVAACQRLIDAKLSGRPAMYSDVKIVAEYFR
jgi:hypothetical protein